MRLAIDASRTTVSQPTGTEHYSLRLLHAFIAHNDALPADQRHDLTLYFRDLPPRDLFPTSARRRVIPFRRAWTHVRFAAALQATRPDLTWVTAHTLPFLFPGRAVVTVHDLGYRLFPSAHPPRQRAYLELTTRYSARRAALVFADSAATAADLTRLYGTAPDKIRVVYPGVDAPAVTHVAAVRHKYALPDEYFLFLGTLQPRKNIARIAQAYRLFRQRNPASRIGLVLAGGRGWLFDPQWTAGIPGITLTGYIEEADKGALYAGAQALVFPSLYEGFGFPVIEAMHTGTPVLCSSTSSLPELAADAALTVDPLDVDAIADSMARLAFDDGLRTRLIARGRVRAHDFTWQRAAAAAMDAFATLES